MIHAGAHQQINAIKSFGILVKVTHKDFLHIVGREKQSLVLTTTKKKWFFGYRYLVSYKGLAFYTNSSFRLELPHGTEVVTVEDIRIP